MANVTTSVLVCFTTIIIGMLLVVQTLVNTKASIHFSIQIFGCALPFTIGTGLLTLLVILEGHLSQSNDNSNRKPLFAWSSAPPWYLFLAGTVGVCLLTVGLVVTFYLGSAMFWVPLVVGQISCSALLDHFGVSLNGERKPFSIVKAFAMGCTFAGAALSVYRKIAAELHSTSLGVGVVVGLVITSLLTGCILPFQAVINREASKLLASKLTAVWWSFLEGATLSNVILLVQLCVDQSAAKTFPARFNDSQWFMYLGGAIGVVYVASALWFTGIVGFELYFVCLVSGQLAGSLLFDSVNTEISGSGADVSSSGIAVMERIFGIFLVIVGACLIKLKLPGSWQGRNRNSDYSSDADVRYAHVEANLEVSAALEHL